MGGIPHEMRWLFWDVDVDRIDVDAHAYTILGRVLEFGRMVDVRWALATYGKERIHDFLRTSGHPELSDRTVGFWAYFHAEDEAWQTPPAWRKSNVASWPG